MRLSMIVLTMVPPASYIAVIGALLLSSSSSQDALASCRKREGERQQLEDKMLAAMKNQGEAIEEMLITLKKQDAVIHEQADLLDQLKEKLR